MEANRLGNNRVKKPVIILDTNMLLLLYRGKQVFDNIEEKLAIKPDYICPETVVLELEKFSKEKNSNARIAKRVIENLDKLCRRTPSKSPSADKDIIIQSLELQEKGHIVIVATNDRDLRRKLREAGIPTAYYRESQDRIEIEYIPLL